MKKTIIIMAIVLVPFFLGAQVRIDWQQSYGSLEGDYSYSIHKTDDGFMVLGMVDTDPHSGMYDCDGSGSYIEYRANWLFEIDGEQSMIKQNCYSIGLYPKLHKTGNGLYYITELGYTSNWLFNLKITQIDNEGNVLWTRSLGTLHGIDDCADDVFGITTIDGGVVAATLIDDASGDVIQHYGGTDCWVVKLDAVGNTVWQISLGTEGNERVTCLQESSDGGLLVWLDSEQTGNGNIGCGQPEKKGVLVKMDAFGQIQWNICFERTSACSIIEMDDGYLLAGDQRYTVEPNGNCGDGIYTYDCYLLRCDLEGNVIWDKEFGGSCNDRLVKVLHNGSDNGFTAFTNSKSMDGDVESFVNLGVIGNEEGNIWVFHVNAEGELLWEYCIGSQLGLLEEVRDVVAVSDGEYAIVGNNTWFDGVSSGMVNCSNNLLLPNSGSNIWVMHLTDIFNYDFFEEGSEWYYEILNDNGSITYQHLEYASDTTIGTERPKVIVRSNTQYDRDTITKVTHEYVYEENGKVYWWNKDLEEFTVLYDLAAQTDDEWEIKVGTQSIIMHVDAVENYVYEGQTYRMLRVSDANDFFSGDIVCGIGHLTSFFPERLMRDIKSFRVDGLRCYWVDDVLLYHNGDEDCDVIHSQLQGLDEPMGRAMFAVYPNPTNSILVVETWRAASQPIQTYCITNLMGQALLQGSINADCQQINIESLPAGMYFISIGDATLKFVVR